MGRLLLVELRRALARGVTRVLTLLGVLLIAVTGLLVFVLSDDVETLRAEARAEFQSRVEQCVAGQSSFSDDGEGDFLSESPPPRRRGSISREECEAVYAPVLDRAERSTFRVTELWPEARADEPSPVGFFLLLDTVVMAPGMLLMLGGVIAGASLVGGEWQAGSFVTLLTWEPRRVRLLAARLFVTGFLGVVITVAMLALFTAALLPTAAFKGIGLTVPEGWWLSYADVVVRLGLLTGLAAACAGALAMIGRRTVLALAAVVGYVIFVELILVNLWDAISPWLVLRNVTVVLGRGDLVPDGDSLLQGLAVLSAWAGVIIVGAHVLFSRRDFASTS
jgi:ABC-2 type transport system permease protein